MKKITDFIVEKRYFILVLFLILTVISLFLSNQVKVNHDMTKYLPDSSDTRKGMDIMDKEFKELKDSSLNIMVKDLTVEEKEDAYEYLKKIDNVNDVSYDDTDKYNKDEYSLYVLTIDAEADSSMASDVYKTVTEYFGDKLVDTSGTASDYNKVILPFYIIVLAVLSALVILIIMCESYVEPFLFLIAILIAVALNGGTNIIFDSVSNITSSISAILQMALSMDYSIMLMNRYRQERLHEEDKVKAMKEALHNAFKAISSSSVTTVVGLLALVFMSFKIGKDLGFVLAKGVLFSLISIFTCLPGLIIMCDKLIYKTKKKSPIITLNYVGKIAYKLRYVAAIIFLAIFITSYFLKGNLGILYTASGADQIDNTFKLNNQMAIVYPNQEESKMSNYCLDLDDDDIEVLCYGNTINQPLKYSELNAKFTDLGKDVQADNYLLKLIYYHYYNAKENNTIRLDNLLKFIEKDVYANEKMSDDIDESMRNDINRLEMFADAKLVNEKRTAASIAQVLNIDVNKVNDLLIYYNSKKTVTKLSLREFALFMNSDVVNSKYGNDVKKEKENINNLLTFTNSQMIQKRMTAQELAKTFNIDSQLVNSLFTYYASTKVPETHLSLKEFSSFILSDIVTDEAYQDMFADENTIASIKIMNDLSDIDTINTPMDSTQLSTLLDQDVSLLFYLLADSTGAITPYDFVTKALASGYITDENINRKLTLLKGIMDSALANKTFSYQEVSSMMGLDEQLVMGIYTLYYQKGMKLTPYEFVNFILKEKDNPLLKDNLNDSMLEQLKTATRIMDSALKETIYTSDNLASFLGMDKDTIKLIYSLYDKNVKKNQVKLSFKEFVSFLINDVMKNKSYANLFTDDMKEKITIVDKIINNTLNNRKYNKDELYDLLIPLAPDLNKDLIDLVYIYYGSVNDYQEKWQLTIETFVDYLNSDILKDQRFDSYIDQKMRTDIEDAKVTVKDARDLLLGENYSRMVLNTNFEPESKATFKFIGGVKKNLNDGSYIIGDSPMAYDMSKSFQGELNLITILTMIFIFLVVAWTFKSILLPILLVLLIQCAVFLTMGILSFGGSVYYMSILIVQSILMGATIDYAILYTSYYLEEREKSDIKASIIKAYNDSIHTILTSASILIIVTLIVGYFSSAVAAKICTTLSQGTLCSAILILVLLPAVIASIDKIVIHKKDR